ncbi:ArdC-like ssDNA-binding domain-containing protein [Oceanobacillus sp. 1P07AA]|uniref:ArdC-like ssDNA-binding domain-containing protein n=1 Tax=Oceanobacillus sp. 1P07AA TaxID=3132293 RepID=UPI0039A5ACE7
MVTNQIISNLEKGTVPWKKPFASGQAVNWNTQKPYRGINTMLLDGGEYLTFKQIKDAGGKVKKGEKSQIIVFWKWLEIEEKETEEEKNIPFLKYYRVFEVGSQVKELSQKENMKHIYTTQ